MKLLRSSRFHANDFVIEVQLRLFFYLSVYLRRLIQKKKVNLDIPFLIDSCLHRAAALKLTAPSGDPILSKSVWEHLYSDGLSIRLQSVVLAKKPSGCQSSWNVVLLDALSRDSLSKDEQLKFDFLCELEEHVKSGVACLHNPEELYSKLLEYKPSDLSTILWYVLRPVKVENTSDTDLALPVARLKVIVDSVKQVFSMTPLSVENCGVCQLDAIVFLVALSVSYLIRYASSETPGHKSRKNALSWPPQPLCLLNTRMLPSGMQRRCWNDLCTCAKNKSSADESSLTQFIDQLRFVKPTRAASARLILRVAQATTRLPLDASAIDCTLARAARAWEAGLKALMENSELTQLGSPPLSVREQYPDEGILFPSELNSDWWHGTHVENLITVASKDQAWFFLGWRWLASYWLEHPLPKLEALMGHLQYLRDRSLPTDIECTLLAAKLVENAMSLGKTSPLLEPLGNLAMSLLNTSLMSVQRTPFTDESMTRPTRNLSDAITSLQKALESLNASAQSTEVQSSDPSEAKIMPSGYGVYANGSRTSIFGTYRSPGLTGSPAAVNTATSSDLQTKLMTQVVEQWMPSFMEFSRIMSETSAELAKSRLQNEELSRLLKETRNQLDTVIAEQQKQQQRSPVPVRQPTPPTQLAPSLEDWRALQESLREVTSILRDFRHWLPTAIPSFAPPPPFPHPPHIPPAQPPAMLRPGDIFALENQQKAQLALSQLAAFQQQQQQQMPRTTAGSCFLLPPPSYPPPTIPPQAASVDFRVPPVATGLFPASMSTSTTLTSTSASSVDLPKGASSVTTVTASVQSVKSPLTSASASASATGLSKNTPTDPKQVTPAVGTASSPVSKPLPFTFKPAATTTTDTFKTETSSLFSFSKLGSSGTVGPSALFAALPFGHKPSAITQTSGSPDVLKEAESTGAEEEDDEDKPEAFEPKVEFTPCVAKLPELVEQITGEEGERVLFCHRAHLFRWDKSDSTPSGEWKARGIGELKILADDAAVKFRIVMRREQIMKLCANHYILAGISIKRHPQKIEACMWKARDFAVMDIDKPIPNGKDELFMAHFKTEEITDEFEKIVKSCLEKAKEVAQKKSDEKEKTNPASIASCLQKLRPKVGSWTCTTCALIVDQELEKCPACQALKPGGKPVQHIATPAPPTFKFFSTPVSTSSTAASTSFVFGSSGGASSNPTATTPLPKFIFGNASAPTTQTDKSSFSPSVLNASETKASGPTGGMFANLEFPSNQERPNVAFTFKMKPPTPAKSKNIDDSKEIEDGRDTTTEYDDNEEDEVTPSDLSQISFKPVVEHLPEKVEVRTGEEDEEVVFEARAKLFRFDNTVWKERGLGQLKLLRSPSSERTRIVMRRGQVHKVCCNHLITSGMTLKPMEGSKAPVVPWVWWAVDFSCDEAGPEGRKEMFSVRFKTPEESQAFHNAFVKAVAASSVGVPADLEAGEDELVIVENPLSSEQVARARALQLPDDFYAYELKKPGGSSRHSQREDLTPAEEAEEDALLEAAVNRGTSSTSSSLVVVKSTESLVIATPPTSPPPPTSSATTSALQALRGKSGSWKCESCFLLVNPEVAVCPACNANKLGTGEAPRVATPVTAGKPFESDGPKGFSGPLFGSGGRLGGFEALSKEASAKPSFLTASGSSSSPPTWAGAGSTLFSAKGDGKEDNDDDNESDPDPHFEPIIPLPNLVETRTGEEEEVCLFLRRCKLYRLIDNQWKERGIGDMKILVHPKKPPPADFLDSRTELSADKGIEGGIKYARLLMRRDHVLKICTNHTISVDMPQFKPLLVANHGVCWVAKDYSEDPNGEVVTLGLRFKTEQDLTHFHSSIERARTMLKQSYATP
ncbi:E3 SUMO-protein ligase RanBP2 [Taenia crassiceps]|uniref:E3 SUMO-protein ligase RanBP2 n=1 Tax=Taenia crassiceps TaxID=6207 RepID=A0ABR4QR45_9CEST